MFLIYVYENPVERQIAQNSIADGTASMLAMFGIDGSNLIANKNILVVYHTQNDVLFTQVSNIIASIQ